MWRRSPAKVADAAAIVKLQQENDLLKMQIESLNEILASYRDALEFYQAEKRLGTLINQADIAAITKPKAT